jgi:LmbE family N-acetylglucosaminyl deacetylase
MRIAVVVAHPDEESIRYGGTIAKSVKLGHEVTIIILTRGGMGHSSIPPEELCKIRTEEVGKAAKILGARLVMLDYEDQWIPYDCLALGKALIDPLREAKPDVILCHDPTVSPCDQSNTSRGILVAAHRIYFPLLVTKYPPVPIPDIYHLPEMNQRPHIYIDISDVIEIKKAAMRCHQTQIEAARNLYWKSCDVPVTERDVSKAEELWLEDQVRRDRFWGDQSGAEYAEAFVAFRSVLNRARNSFPTLEEITR